MGKNSPWNVRRVAVTMIFALTLAYGAHELLWDRPSGPSAPAMARPAQAATMRVEVPGGRAGEKAVRPSPAPCREAMEEAERWRARSWDGVELFSGESWTFTKDTKSPAPVPAEGDTLLQATSYSSDGWRAVVGGRVLREGDPHLGGKVVSISEGKVVVRGPGWERVLRFSKTRGN